MHLSLFKNSSREKLAAIFSAPKAFDVVNLQNGISCYLRFHGNEVNDHLISQMLSDVSLGLMKGMRSNLSDGQT